MKAIDTQPSNQNINLRIPKQTRIAKPFHFVFAEASKMQNHIIVEDDAEVTVIEEYHSSSVTHSHITTEIIMGKNARLHFYKLQDEVRETEHRDRITIQQSENSRVDFFTFSKGAAQQQDEVDVHLNAMGAECYLTGFYRLESDNQTLNHRLNINHCAEHSKSSMFYKGIIDKNAKAVFNGKVKVQPQAQHIQTSQTNHHILLSKWSEAISKPELEIYADNVKCTHGATTGQLDAETLFYLRTRGIDQALAVQMLLDAYAFEVFLKIEDAALRQYFLKRMGAHVEL